MATIRSPRIPTSPRTAGAPVPSTIEPPWKTISGRSRSSPWTAAVVTQSMIYDTKMPLRPCAPAPAAA